MEKSCKFCDANKDGICHVDGELTLSFGFCLDFKPAEKEGEVSDEL